MKLETLGSQFNAEPIKAVTIPTRHSNPTLESSALFKDQEAVNANTELERAKLHVKLGQLKNMNEREVELLLLDFLQEDQESRAADEPTDHAGDAKRLQITKQLIEAGVVNTPLQKLVASFIHHHADFVVANVDEQANQQSVKNFEAAHRLAVEAIEGSQHDPEYWNKYKALFDQLTKGQTKFGKNPAPQQVAQWVAKATYDRWQLAQGLPQKFNTQKDLG